MVEIKGRGKEYQEKANQMESEITIFIWNKVKCIANSLKETKKGIYKAEGYNI